MASITIHLLREEVKTSRDALTAEAARYPIGEGESHYGELFVAPRQAKYPKWASKFEKYVDKEKIGKTQSTGALFLTKVDGRIFAVTFGLGRFLLRQEAIEERFGLLVTLNSLGSNSLRSVDKKTFDSGDRNSRVQTGQESPASEFGIDIERDLVRGVVGYPMDHDTYGKRLAGADALTVSKDVSVENIRALLRKFYKLYVSEKYKDNFSWIDQIRMVKPSTELHGVLTEILMDKLEGAWANKGVSEDCWLAIPDVINWDQVVGFRYGRRERDSVFSDIHLRDFLDTVSDDESITTDLLRRRVVYAVNEDQFEIQRWPVYRCLHCEISHEGQSYVMSGGNWFRINVSFSEEVEAYYRSISDFNGEFLTYSHENERKYNEDAVRKGEGYWALMDRKDIKVGGVYDKVEFCDLYGKGREIVHVKHYGASNVLGHLFNQGVVSGELLKKEKKYSTLVDEKLPGSHKMKFTDSLPRDVSGYTIVFGIISKSPKKKLHIPFFAKVALKNAHERLMGLGYRDVAVKKISCDPLFVKKMRVMGKMKRKA